MGLKITGISETIVMIENDAKRSTAAALKALELGAELIKKRAQDYAPVDEGNLEAAIETGSDRGGINGRKRLYVGVNDSLSVPGRPGKTVGDYSGEMHEGDYSLGPKSEAKAQALGVMVGRKFLDRATEELEPDINKAIRAAVKKAI